MNGHLSEPIVTVGDQIAITIGLFAGISGIVVTAAGLVMAAYAMRRGKPEKTPTGRNVRLFIALSYNFLLLFCPLIISMIVIAQAMLGMLDKERLFVLEMNAYILSYIFLTPIVLNFLALTSFLSMHFKKQDRKYKFEAIICGINISLVLVLFFITDDKSRLAISSISILCFIQICFGLLLSWVLMRKE
ncbi:hypothetical protein PghCCS26_40270 [Paenibacillus glycanilyticus]|uniref:Uncharacterized protein n=1 Tax=Paenibacillus glycanilyticus TaxID=126569 RepID=A0ABQ6NQQ6_9BACL|nr:hypothetical protein [Paenibacillus glycanilyticus]GMK46898.1 hypothetical protein PghCCS26_40270 [Paenibacillus glycanilyticus]